MPRRARNPSSGSSSGHRRRRDEDEDEPISENSTSGSDFIADSAEEAEDEEWFAPDEDAPPAPAMATPVPSLSPPRLLMPMQMPNRARKKWTKGKKVRMCRGWCGRRPTTGGSASDQRPATRPRTPGPPRKRRRQPCPPRTQLLTNP
ncbi:unnamed protein product [Urochloa humidicola]